VEAEQLSNAINSNILNSLAAVTHKTKCNAAGNRENVVHLRYRLILVAYQR